MCIVAGMRGFNNFDLYKHGLDISQSFLLNYKIMDDFSIGDTPLLLTD